jgi:hypothetical protein
LIIASAMALIAGFHAFLYVAKTTTCALYQDHAGLTGMGFVDKIMRGTWVFGDLWAAYNDVHRSPLGMLILIGNIKSFHWNPQYELYLAAGCTALTTCLTFWLIGRLIPQGKPLAIIACIIPMLFICCSLNDWENRVFSGGSYHILQASGYMLTATLLPWLIDGKYGARMMLILLLCWCILFATGIYSTAFALATLAGLAIYAAATTVPVRKCIGPAASIVLFLAVYWCGLSLPSAEGEHASSFILSARIFPTLFTSAIMHNEFLAMPLANWAQLSIGITVLVLLLVCMIFAIRHLNEHRWLMCPIILMFHGLLVAAMVSVGRADLGLNAGLSSRYVSQSHLAIIGIAIVLSFQIITKARPQRLNSLIAFSLLLTLAACVAWSSKKEWSVSPYRKVAYERMVALTLFPPSNLEELSIFQAPPVEAMPGIIQTWKQYDLGPFNVYKTNGTFKNPIFLSGFFTPEGDGWRWMEAIGVIMVPTKDFGSLVIRGYRPDGDYANQLKISVNDELVSQSNIATGPFRITLPVPKNQMIKLALACEQSLQSDSSKTHQRAIIISKISFD